MKSEIRDCMRIDWDVLIDIDETIVLRADVFHSVEDGAQFVAGSDGNRIYEIQFVG